MEDQTVTTPQLTERLTDLAGRIEARITDLRERGEFSGVHAAAFADIRARRSALEERMEEAVAAGEAGRATLIELRRDVDALVDGFEEAVFAIDARGERARNA
jgi:hypothetical protein